MKLENRGRSRKFARFVLFRPIKKRSFNLLCVWDLFFRTLAVNSVSDFVLLLLLLFYTQPLSESYKEPSLSRWTENVAQLSCGPDPLSSDSILRIGLIWSVAMSVAIQYAVSSVHFHATDRIRPGYTTESDIGSEPLLSGMKISPDSALLSGIKNK